MRWARGVMAVDAVTTNGVSRKKADETDPAGAQQRLAAEMIKQARGQGMAVTGPDGLLGQLTKTVLASALETEMIEHVGRAKHADQPGREGTNVRNGSRAKTCTPMTNVRGSLSRRCGALRRGRELRLLRNVSTTLTTIHRRRSSTTSLRSSPASRTISFPNPGGSQTISRAYCSLWSNATRMMFNERSFVASPSASNAANSV